MANVAEPLPIDAARLAGAMHVISHVAGKPAPDHRIAAVVSVALPHVKAVKTRMRPGYTPQELAWAQMQAIHEVLAEPVGEGLHRDDATIDTWWRLLVAYAGTEGL